MTEGEEDSDGEAEEVGASELSPGVVATTGSDDPAEVGNGATVGDGFAFFTGSTTTAAVPSTPCHTQNQNRLS